ncbi:hypothetical protein WICPIJ_004440 [Wickerhamomyces pijperi]|uniref:Uncharacterized protein n=1 Tax=Wickerhamomyces pijperi TaxID=599730 RepID=A0A9P8Q7V9_WICPI|nr:hypothetical protein WICPIJ_004440 [Wickerhamomyces pijperi]
MEGYLEVLPLFMAGYLSKLPGSPTSPTSPPAAAAAVPPPLLLLVWKFERLEEDVELIRGLFTEAEDSWLA